MTTNRPPLLILDARARAILQEMGVRVWLPSADKSSIPQPLPAPLKTQSEQASTLALPVRTEPPLRLPVIAAPVSVPTNYSILNMPQEGEFFDWVLIGEPCADESEKLLVNIQKVLPGSVWVAQMTLSPDEAASVQNQIRGLNAKVLVMLGSHAAKAVLGVAAMQTTFAKLRETSHRVLGCAAKVIVTYHPVQLLRHTSAKAQVWKDLKRAMKELA